MKNPQTPQNSQTVEEDSKTQLQEKLETLEKEWSSIKQHLHNPNPNNPNSFRRRSIYPSSCRLSNKIKNIPVLECSPRGLMSSLQHGIDDDVADYHEEYVIRKEIRRFDAGIKGRRLFAEEDPPTPPPEDDEVASEVCSSGSCLDIISECVDSLDCDKVEGYGCRSRSIKNARVLIVVALMACVLGMVRRFSSFGFGEEEMVLVPT